MGHRSPRAPNQRRLTHLRMLLAKGASFDVAAYVSATGSAGTLAAGDLLKEQTGARIAAVEALECPTLLYNGYGDQTSRVSATSTCRSSTT